MYAPQQRVYEQNSAIQQQYHYQYQHGDPQHHRVFGKLRGKLKDKIIQKMYGNAMMYAEYTPAHQDMMHPPSPNTLRRISPSNMLSPARDNTPVPIYSPTLPSASVPTRSPHLAPSTWREPPSWAANHPATPSPPPPPTLAPTPAAPVTNNEMPATHIIPTNPAALHAGGRLIAHMPEGQVERRRLALTLLDDIDAYEQVQQRSRLFRVFPPLRFRVGLARHVNGAVEHHERILSMEELRVLLERTVAMQSEHDPNSDFSLSYENLVGLQGINRGAKDVSIFPTFDFHPDDLPENKSTCPVCLLNFEEGDELKIVPCLHIYHTQCIDHWLSISKYCPCCKTNVDCDGNGCEDCATKSCSAMIDE